MKGWLLCAVLLAVAITAHAQSRPMPRVGFLASIDPEASLDPFRDALREHGYVEGRNIAIEVRLAIRQPARLAELAQELVRDRVDIIVAGGSDATHAAKAATKTIPIIMTSAADPVASGFVRNLARPEANITGPAGMSVEHGSKRVELIRELLPQAKRLVVLTHARNPAHGPAVKAIEKAGLQAAMDVQQVEVRDAGALDDAFAAIAKLRPQAMLVLADNMLFNQRDRILRMAAQQRLADIYWRGEWVEEGGLISFGTNNPDLYRRAAAYVDRLLKGAKPADLPVETPSKFEVFVNVKSAKVRGISVPPSVLFRADRVIQ